MSIKKSETIKPNHNSQIQVNSEFLAKKRIKETSIQSISSYSFEKIDKNTNNIDISFPFYIPYNCYFCNESIFKNEKSNEKDKYTFCSQCFKVSHLHCLDNENSKLNDDKKMKIGGESCFFCNCYEKNLCFICEKQYNIPINDIKIFLRCELCCNKFHYSCSFKTITFLLDRYLYTSPSMNTKDISINITNTLKQLTSSNQMNDMKLKREYELFTFCKFCFERNKTQMEIIKIQNFLGNISHKLIFKNLPNIHEYSHYQHDENAINKEINYPQPDYYLIDKILSETVDFGLSKNLNNKIGFYLVKWKFNINSTNKKDKRIIYSVETKDFINTFFPNEVKSYLEFKNSVLNIENEKEKDLNNLLTEMVSIKNIKKDYSKFLALKEMNIFAFCDEDSYIITRTFLLNLIENSNRKMKVLLVLPDELSINNMIEMSRKSNENNDKYHSYVNYQYSNRLEILVYELISHGTYSYINDLSDSHRQKQRDCNNIKRSLIELIKRFQGEGDEDRIIIDEIFTRLSLLYNLYNQDFIDQTNSNNEFSSFYGMSIVYTTIENYIIDFSVLSKGFDIIIIDSGDLDIDFSQIIHQNMKTRHMIISNYNKKVQYESPFNSKLSNFLLGFYNNSESFYETSISDINKIGVVNRKFISNNKDMFFRFCETYLKFKILDLSSQNMNIPNPYLSYKPTESILSHSFINKESVNDMIKKINLRFYLNLVPVIIDVDDFLIYISLLKQRIFQILNQIKSVVRVDSVEELKNIEDRLYSIVIDLYNSCFNYKLIKQKYLSDSVEILINERKGIDVFSKAKINALINIVNKFQNENYKEFIYIIYADNYLDEDLKKLRLFIHQTKEEIEKELKKHGVIMKNIIIMSIRDSLKVNYSVETTPVFILLNFDVVSKYTGRLFRSIFTQFIIPEKTIQIFHIYIKNTIDENVVKFFYENFENFIKSEINLFDIIDVLLNDVDYNKITGGNVLQFKLESLIDKGFNWKKFIFNKKTFVTNRISSLELLLKRGLNNLRYSESKVFDVVINTKLDKNLKSIVNGIILNLKGENSLMLNSDELFNSLSKSNEFSLYEYSYQWEYMMNVIFNDKNLFLFNQNNHFSWNQILYKIYLSENRLKSYNREEYNIVRSFNIDNNSLNNVSNESEIHSIRNKSKSNSVNKENNKSLNTSLFSMEILDKHDKQQSNKNNSVFIKPNQNNTKQYRPFKVISDDSLNEDVDMSICLSIKDKKGKNDKENETTKIIPDFRIVNETQITLNSKDKPIKISLSIESDKIFEYIVKLKSTYSATDLLYVFYNEFIYHGFDNEKRNGIYEILMKYGISVNFTLEASSVSSSNEFLSNKLASKLKLTFPFLNKKLLLAYISILLLNLYKINSKTDYDNRKFSFFIESYSKVVCLKKRLILIKRLETLLNDIYYDDCINGICDLMKNIASTESDLYIYELLKSKSEKDMKIISVSIRKVLSYMYLNEYGNIKSAIENIKDNSITNVKYKNLLYEKIFNFNILSNNSTWIHQIEFFYEKIFKIFEENVLLYSI